MVGQVKEGTGEREGRGTSMGIATNSFGFKVALLSNAVTPFTADHINSSLLHARPGWSVDTSLVVEVTNPMLRSYRRFLPCSTAVTLVLSHQ